MKDMFRRGRFPELPATCAQCGAPLASPAAQKDLCHVCGALWEVVGTSEWFILAQVEWERENIRLAILKRALLQ